MASRSLTEVFIMMRNNALQNRHLFLDQHGDDREALVSRDDSDIELGMRSATGSKLPPEWVSNLEEIQYDMARIGEKLKELSALHDRHLNRPTLDDSVAEEHAIEIQTQEITQLLQRCQRSVKGIQAKGRLGTDKEQRLATNIVSSLARSLQDTSASFRHSQSTYLKKMKSREERSKQFFDIDLNDGYVPDEMDEYLDRGFTQVQQHALQDNTEFVLQREREIQDIVRSIHDLNTIFKELSSMVVDQGTILDNIDYNIEQTSQRVDQGLKHLQKAQKYQKKNRKMLVIIILFVIIIMLIVILAAVKS